MSKPNTTTTAISAEEKRLNRARLRLAVLKELRALLRKRHETWKLSQRQLADRLGMDEARVSRILNGDENLTLNTVADFFRALEAVPTVRGEMFEAIESSSLATTTLTSLGGPYVFVRWQPLRSALEASNWAVVAGSTLDMSSQTKAIERYSAYFRFPLTTSGPVVASSGNFVAGNSAKARSRPRATMRAVEVAN